MKKFKAGIEELRISDILLHKIDLIFCVLEFLLIIIEQDLKTLLENLPIDLKIISFRFGDACLKQLDDKGVDLFVQLLLKLNLPDGQLSVLLVKTDEFAILILIVKTNLL